MLPGLCARNGSKMHVSCAAGIGAPPLATDSSNQPPDVRAVSCTAVPRPHASGRCQGGLTRAAPVGAVAIHRLGDIVARLDDPLRHAAGKFGHDVLKYNFDRLAAAAVQGEAAAQPAAREVHDVVDERGHPCRAASGSVDDADAGLRLRHPRKELQAPAIARQWIAQVVPEHGDELLAQRSRSRSFADFPGDTRTARRSALAASAAARAPTSSRS